MRKLIHTITTYISLIAVCLTLSPAFLASTIAATTANPNNGQALEIAPPVITLTANPGQSLKTQIFLRNISSGNLVVGGQANDFVAAGEDGTPKVLLDNQSSNNPYSLKDWVAPPASLQLVPKEIKTMTVTLNVPANASPGGHYGIIRFTATAPSPQGQGVSISASLGSLVLLTVNGKIDENLAVKQFSANHNGKSGSIFQSGPLNFVQRIVNNGNVHEQPTGQVSITDMFGRKVAAVNVNLPPKNILPHSTRKFEEPLDKSVIGNKRLFGHYHADLTLTYGKDKKQLTSTLSFWVIPYRLVAIVIAALILGFFALRLAIRRYNRYIVSRSAKPKR